MTLKFLRAALARASSILSATRFRKSRSTWKMATGMERLSYRAWIKNLSAGKAVRVRHPWRDGKVPGGEIVAGRVIKAFDTMGLSIVVEAPLPGSTRVEKIVFGESGPTGYRQLLHPTPHRSPEGMAAVDDRIGKADRALNQPVVKTVAAPATAVSTT